MHHELLELKANKEKLIQGLPETRPKLVRMNPLLANVYQEKVARLHEELNREPVRAEAAAILRGLISEIRLIPERWPT
jgi:site-specific DNA recombinase